MDGLVGLRVFALVAELKSFIAAAERLGLSPAMTSKHVQHLESRVGARLLNRTSRSVRLTEAGELYLGRVRGLIDGLDEMEARLRETTVTPRGTLKMSLPVWMANARFAQVTADYLGRYPDVLLDLDFEGRMVHLIDEGYDLVIRGARSLDEGLIARKIAEVPFHLVGAPALLDRIGRPGRLQDLEGLPFLAYTPIVPDDRFRIGEGEDAHEIRFRSVLKSRNESMLHLAARAGMGLAFMPTPMVEDDFASGRLERILPDRPPPTAPLYAVYPDRSYLPAKVRTFLDVLFAGDVLGLAARDPPPGTG